jgi:hypothetical protein
MKMKIKEFEHALQEDDFGVGDSFWIGDWEFEVVNTRAAGKAAQGDEVVFRWELTRQEFVQVIADNHPEIEDSEGFFERHEDEIVHCFEKGFDVLVSECGATYGSVMNDAIDESLDEEELPGGSRVARCDSEGSDSRPLSSYSKICKGVNEKMEFNVQSKMEEYLALLERIKERTEDERTAVSLLQEISKDRRSAEIREERGAQSNEPATEKQKQFMKKLNIRFPANVTKHEASAMIDEELGKNGE